MARAIRYAPLHIGGAGFRQLYVEQGILMVQQIHKFLNAPETTIGQLLLTTLSWTQAFMGTSQMILTEVNTPLPPATPSYLLEVRTFLKSINGSIQLSDPPIPRKLRQNDQHIMDIALTQTMWNERHLIQINSCRRFLQAQTLADITTIQGTRIHPSYLDGTFQPDHNQIRVSLFNQAKPGAGAWKTWRRFLSTICNKHAVLHQPLGEWIVDVHQVRHWPSFSYNPQNDCLYSHYHGNQYRKHHRVANGIFSIIPTEDLMPATGHPTAVVITMDTYRPTQKCTVAPSILNYTVIIRGRTIQVAQWEFELLHHCRDMSPSTALFPLIQQGKILVCSDGSSTATGGSFGFVVSTAQGKRLTKGNGPAPGAYSNSFRSEAYGVLGALRWLFHALHGYRPDPTVVVTHYLDNKSVITRIKHALGFKRQFPNTMLLSEHDVVREIVATLQELPVTIEFKWIKSHQDENTSYHKLEIPAQLNCDADKEASSYISPAHANWLKVTPLPHSPSQFLIRDKSITGHYKRRIREVTTMNPLQEYLRKRFGWDETVLETIDITTFQHIILKYHDNWTTIVKHVHDISPTGTIAHRNNQHLPHECPACNLPFEDNIHVLLCAHQSRSEWRNETMQRITNYAPMISDPYLLDVLRDGLLRFHRQLEPLSPSQYPPKYGQLITQQNNIGWDQVYRGRWSKEWNALHIQSIRKGAGPPSDYDISPWIIGLGRLLMDQWLKLWTLRNTQRHGKDLDDQLKNRSYVLRSELTAIYEYKDKVCPSEHSLFHESVEAHLAQHPNLDSIESWINMYRNAIQASATQAERLGIRQNRQITGYPMFNPIAPTCQQASQEAGLPAS